MLNQIQPFVNWLRRRNPRARTWRDYHHILTRFASIVQHPAAADVSVHDIDTYIAVLVDDGLQPATINRYLSIVSSFYGYLAAEDPDLLSPIHRRRHFLRKPHRLPRPVPLPDLQRFFAAIDDLRDRALFLLMLRGGLRIAEVAGLQLQDLRLTVAPPRLRVFGKNSKERTIYLSPQMRTALAAYLAVRPAVLCDALFLPALRRIAHEQFAAHENSDDDKPGETPSEPT